MARKNYRLYCLNERGGINLADWIAAESDEDAIAKAQAIEHGARMAEVWDGHRLVITLKGDDLSATS